MLLRQADSEQKEALSSGQTSEKGNSLRHAVLTNLHLGKAEGFRRSRHSGLGKPHIAAL